MLKKNLILLVSFTFFVIALNSCSAAEACQSSSPCAKKEFIRGCTIGANTMMMQITGKFIPTDKMMIGCEEVYRDYLKNDPLRDTLEAAEIKLKHHQEHMKQQKGKKK